MEVETIAHRSSQRTKFTQLCAIAASCGRPAGLQPGKCRSTPEDGGPSRNAAFGGCSARWSGGNSDRCGSTAAAPGSTVSLSSSTHTEEVFDRDRRAND